MVHVIQVISFNKQLCDSFIRSDCSVVITPSASNKFCITCKFFCVIIRWKNTLDRSINFTPWTYAEDKTLWQFVQEHGEGKQLLQLASQIDMLNVSSHICSCLQCISSVLHRQNNNSVSRY
jgi:hypothetical protein